MGYFLPCRLCLRNNLVCLPNCLSAPFFPNHTVFETDQVNSVFATTYILAFLIELLPKFPQPSSTILFMRYLFNDAYVHFLNPIYGTFGTIQVLTIWKNAEIKQLRRELNVVRAQAAQRAHNVVMVESGSENSGPLPPPPPV